jgi:hypothetical protein
MGSLYRRDDRMTASHAFSVTADGQRLMSTAAQTYQEISLSRLASLWASLAAGMLALLYLALSGLSRVVTRRVRPTDASFLPIAASLGLLLPLPLFYLQPILELGDLTLASGMLAAVTGALPVAMIVGLALNWRRRPWQATAALDVAAMLAVLQFTGVLAYYGLLPLRLWA